MNLVNLPAVRSEAIQKLRTGGFKPLTDLEAAYIGYRIHESLLDSPQRGDSFEDPLIQSVEFDVDVLRLGKWDWLIAWLSPAHEAAKLPQALADIALVLLGRQAIPEEVQARLLRHLKKLKQRV